MKRILTLFLAAICGLSLLSGCGGQDPTAFITMTAAADGTSIKLGMSRDAMNVLKAPNSTNTFNDADCGMKRKWQNGDNFNNLVAVILVASVFHTGEGISLDSAAADVLPAYQKDPDVKVLQNDSSKLILGKQINGVNYTATFRFYPDGSVKTITLTNTDLYTEDEADYT